MAKEKKQFTWDRNEEEEKALNEQIGIYLDKEHDTDSEENKEE